MSNLFIIGNGFDAYIHGLSTTYLSFRYYLLKEKLNLSDDEIDDFIPEDDIPEIGEDKDGGSYYDKDKAISYIVGIIDQCSDYDEYGCPKWSSLEKYLGDSIYDSFTNCLFDIHDYSEGDKEWAGIYNNEDKTNDIKYIFRIIMELFEEWVNTRLIYISAEPKQEIANIINKSDNYFVNFNYTSVLEKCYGIRDDKVLHIHGKAGTGERIIFGHGDDKEIKLPFKYLGADYALSELKKELRKPTNELLPTYMDFIKNIETLDKIYSSGFSFSDVDKCYIEAITYIYKPETITWYFNKHDYMKNPNNCLDYIKSLGFNVDVANW